MWWKMPFRAEVPSPSDDASLRSEVTAEDDGTASMGSSATSPSSAKSSEGTMQDEDVPSMHLPMHSASQSLRNHLDRKHCTPADMFLKRIERRPWNLLEGFTGQWRACQSSRLARCILAHWRLNSFREWSQSLHVLNMRLFHADLADCLELCNSTCRVSHRIPLRKDIFGVAVN